ncbi:MAG: insulinase family protein [Anaerolineae bacterium]|nr:insulinase family protein [Anaerolineae bacterium]
MLSGSFAAGSVFEAPEQAGLAAITAEAMLRGTTQRSFADLHETLESNAMSLGFSSGRFLTSFDGKALGDDLPLLLDILHDVLHNPAFPEDQVALIKGEVITGMRYRQLDTRYMANKRFQELAYPPNHIFHRSNSGEIETVSPLTAEDCRAYYARQYGPAQFIMVVVGAVKTAEAIATVEAALGHWHNPNQQTTWEQPPLLELNDIRHALVTLPGKTQSDLVLGVPGPARSAPDYRAAMLANNVLGVFGMMGRLGSTIREDKGWAYYSASSLEGGIGPGPWRAYAGVNPANVKEAVQLIRQEINRMLDEPVNTQELADNQSNLVARLPLRLEKNEGVAANLMAMERFGLGLDYLRRYSEEIQALTPADLQAAMHKYWKPDAFALSVAGPEIEAAL